MARRPAALVSLAMCLCCLLTSLPAARGAVGCCGVAEDAPDCLREHPCGCDPTDVWGICYVYVPDCDVQTNVVPTGFIVFNQPDSSISPNGVSLAIGDTVFILAKFPDNVCNLPDPYEMGPTCLPTISLNVDNKILTASPVTSTVEADYTVSFMDQNELYTTDFRYKSPWVFILTVEAGMNVASLDVKWIQIPSDCNAKLPIQARGPQTQTNVQNFSTRYTFGGDVVMPKKISIDTRPPSIASVSTSQKQGNYTAGEVINIVVRFSKDVYLSQLPNIYSQVYLDAQAAGVMLYGVPYLELNSGAFVALRGYDNPKSFSSLSFLYKVAPGEETPVGKLLDVSTNTTVVLNGGFILDLNNGLEVNLDSMPAYGSPGSLSEAKKADIVIYRTGNKFPPHKYDPTATPLTSVTATGRRNGQVEYSRRVLAPTIVTANFQLNAVYNINEKGQQFQADFILVLQWFDTRLKDAKAPRYRSYPVSALGVAIWSPMPTFANRRDTSNPIEGSVTVENNGNVTVVNRYLATYSINLDIRDFPFDTQTFAWNLRSTSYNNTIVKFQTQGTAGKQAASQMLGELVDPTFVYYDYDQKTYTIEEGIFASYDLLSITIKADRIATMSAIFLIFPLCMLCLALALALQQEVSAPSRLQVPMAVMTGTMGFSYVIGNACPPVSYTTRIHLLIFQTYIFAVALLAFNYYLYIVDKAKKDLGKKNTDNKNLLADVDWLTNKVLGCTPTIAHDQVPIPPKEEKKGEGKKTEASIGVVAVSNEPGGAETSGNVAINVADEKQPSEETKEKKQDEKKDEASKEKNFASGAIGVDTKGKFVDVKDLLKRPEVKAFKVMKWGAEPVKFCYGLFTISMENQKKWGDHISFVDNLLKHIAPCLMAISIGSILGERNLTGLGAAPMPSLGKPN